MNPFGDEPSERSLVGRGPYFWGHGDAAFLCPAKVVHEALSISSKPCVFMELANKEHISWPELIMAVEALVVEEFSDPILVLIIAADQHQHQSSVDITWHSIGEAQPDPHSLINYHF